MAGSQQRQQVVDGGADLSQVALEVEERRRADRDHDVVSGRCVGRALGELEAAAGGHAVQQPLGPGLAPGHPPGADRLQHRAVVIDAEHAYPAVGKRERERQADPAKADHRDGSLVGHLRVKTYLGSGRIFFGRNAVRPWLGRSGGGGEASV